MAHNINCNNKSIINSTELTTAKLCKCQPNINVSQTLNEMEFERGIWSAALYNELIKLKNFISKGNVNDRDNTGYTALHYASRNGHFDACKLLIESGADINAITNGGVTALHRATMMGRENIVKLLIDKNAKLTIQDNDGETVLHRAVKNGNEKIIQLLLDNEKELKNISNNKGQTPIDIIDNNKFPYLKSYILNIIN